MKSVSQEELDWFVEGEFEKEQRDEFFERLDAEPDGWKRCALALLERDALSGMFGDAPVVSDESEIQEESVGFLGHLPAEGMNLKDKMVEFEIEMIRQALDSQDGVVSHAAELLSMRRTTLVEKMKKYGLNKDG